MTIAIVEDQFNAHLVGCIGYRRSTNLSHLYFTRQTKIALYQERYPQKRNGHCQEPDTTQATLKPEPTPGEPACTSIVFFVILTHQPAPVEQPQTPRNNQPDANTPNMYPHYLFTTTR